MYILIFIFVCIISIVLDSCNEIRRKEDKWWGEYWKNHRQMLIDAQQRIKKQQSPYQQSLSKYVTAKRKCYQLGYENCEEEFIYVYTETKK